MIVRGKCCRKLNGHSGYGLWFSIWQACLQDGYRWKLSAMTSAYKRGADCHGQR